MILYFFVNNNGVLITSFFVCKLYCITNGECDCEGDRSLVCVLFTPKFETESVIIQQPKLYHRVKKTL